MARLDCRFETERLTVEDWRGIPDRAATVRAMLTEPVTRTLPEPWRGAYDDARATAWIRERDAEGTTLVVTERASAEPIGLMILFADGGEVRLGYLLAESAWGKGYATELLASFVAWCRGREEIAALVGGVEPGNAASARVLEKCGFRSRDGELFRLDLAG